MKSYLGDGVYVDWDGYQLALTAENGVEVTNVIYLDSTVYAGLVAYVERLKASYSVTATTTEDPL